MVDKPQDFCPYVGLAPFESDHAEYYFGRSLDAATLADNVIATPLTVLYGSSGTGKTSLINVGLPRAIAQLGRSVDIVSFRSWQGDKFLVSLANAISNTGTAADLSSHHDTPGLSDSLQKRAQQTGRPVVLVFDQFEEYFVYERSSDVTAGLENELAKIIRNEDLKVNVLISIREDRFHLLDRLRINIPDILDNTLELGHLADEAVREAITGPITIYNERWRRDSSPIRINRDFTNLLISQLKEIRAGAGRAAGRSDAERPVELPYLQLALEKLWDAAGGAEATIFDEALLNAHPVSRIVRDHLDKVIACLEENDQQICADIFDRLVTRSGTKFAMTAYDLAAYADTANNEEAVAKVLYRLAEKEARIVKTVPGLGDKPAFEIFHDVLGPPLLAWRMRYRAEQRAKAEHAKLAQEEETKRVELAQKEKEARAQVRFYRRTTFTVGLLFISAAIAVFIAAWEWQRAEATARQVEVSLLWSQVSSNWQEDMNDTEVDAVWKLAADDATLRSDFINQLNRDPTSLARLGVRANPITRAIGLKWPQEAVNAVQKYFESSTIPSRNNDFSRSWKLVAFARGLSALGDQLGEETYKKGLRIIEYELKQFSSNESKAEPINLLFAAIALSVLGKQKELSSSTFNDTKEKIKEVILKQLDEKCDAQPQMLRAIAVAIQEITSDLPPKDVSRIVVYLLKEIKSLETLGQQTIARSINAVATRFDQKEISGTIITLVKSLSRTTGGSVNPPARLPILQAIEELAKAWCPEKDDPVFVELVNIVSQENAAIENDKALIARAAIPLLQRFPPEHARSSITELIKFIFSADDTTAKRIAAAITPATEATSHTPLNANDVSVLTTPLKKTLKETGNPQTKISPDQVASASENLISARARFLAIVAPYFTVEQVEHTFPMIVKVCERTNDPIAREALTEALVAFAPKMDAKMRANALRLAKYRLANSGSLDEATAWAEVIATFLEHETDNNNYVAAIVEVLKYPTSAGRPTKVLLDHLYRHFKDLNPPKPSDNPWRAVAWIEKEFPKIELNTPPTRPMRPQYKD